MSKHNNKMKPHPSIERAARALVDRLELVHADDRYKAIWFTAHNHGVVYTGPKYDVELRNLRDALGSAERAGETNTDDPKP